MGSPNIPTQNPLEKYQDLVRSLFADTVSCTPVEVRLKTSQERQSIATEVDLAKRSTYEGSFHAAHLFGGLTVFQTHLDARHPVFSSTPKLGNNIIVFDNYISGLVHRNARYGMPEYAQVPTSTPVYSLEMQRLLESWKLPSLITGMILLHSDVIPDFAVTPPCTDVESLAEVALYRSIVEDEKMSEAIEACIVGFMHPLHLSYSARSSREALIKLFTDRLSDEKFNARIAFRMRKLLRKPEDLSSWLSQGVDMYYADGARVKLLQELERYSKETIEDASDALLGRAKSL